MSRLLKVEFTIKKVRSAELYQLIILVMSGAMATFLVLGSLTLWGKFTTGQWGEGTALAVSLLILLLCYGLGLAMHLKGLELASKEREELQKRIREAEESTTEPSIRDLAQQVLTHLERPHKERRWRWFWMAGLWLLGFGHGFFIMLYMSRFLGR